MKKKQIKIMALIMSLGVAVTLLLGCVKEEDMKVISQMEKEENRFSESGPRLSPASENVNSTSTVEEERKDAVSLENVSYVMIYNPYFYDENNKGIKDPSSLFSGNFSSQIATGTLRADGLGEKTPVLTTIGQDVLSGGLDLNAFEIEPDRASGIDPIYEEGDTKEFYCGWQDPRTKEIFTCLYEGENCYVWSLKDAISQEQAETCGNEFDEKIYPTDVEYFGTARFTENGGKINLLFYPIVYQGSGMLLGYFHPYDLFTTEEAGTYIEKLGMNTDHAIVHINSEAFQRDEEDVYSTMGHELQHLICQTAMLKSDAYMKTWLNESMSAYAEDLLYLGSKDEGGYNKAFYESEKFRKGQSLYNFSTKDDRYIGAYGIVYLFAEYLSDSAGEDIFSAIHEYWRNADEDVTEEEAIANTVPNDIYDGIDQKYVFSDSIQSGFEDKYQAWFSKMTLDFYLNTFQSDIANLGEEAERCYQLMQYREVNPLDVEGGGRVFVATKNKRYVIPADAAENLVYIGLDNDFNIVTTYGVND